MKNLKNLIFSGVLLLAIPSCMSYKYTTFAPCLPEEKDSENEQRYTEKSDSTYTIELKSNPITKDRELRAKYNFMQSD